MNPRVLILCLLSLVAAAPVAVADVRAQLSAREGYVGMPVMLYVQVAGAVNQKTPVIPPIDGLKISSARRPSFATSTIIRNGRRTVTSQITHAFRITPEKPGDYRLPPLAIETDQGIESTRPIAFSVKTSETGDLMFAEVDASLNKVYVGQPIVLTLRLWLKPFIDEQREIKLTHRQMWDRVRQTQSDWGVFTETLQELAENGEGIRAATAIHPNGDGEDEPYYLYEIEATIYPKTSGTLGADGMQIVVHYPTELGESNDLMDSFFGSSPFSRRGSLFGPTLEVTAARPITIQPDFPPIEIAPIPLDNRPGFYQGAVGQFAMVTRATPVDVQAGDPVTLTIGIRGTGPMEGVQAPPLAAIDALTEDFKVADEPLAGIVQDDVKVFSTTIRPRNENVSEVPSIPFSYFDPMKETFVTAKSDPIAINVRKADRLAVDSIVGSAADPQSALQDTDDQDQEPSLGLRAVSIDSSLQSEPIGSSFAWAWLLGAPVICLMGWIVRHRDRFAANQLTRSRVGAAVASTGDPRVIAKRIADFAKSRGEKIPAKLKSDIEDLATRCDAAAFARDAGQPIETLRQIADGILNRVSKISPVRSHRFERRDLSRFAVSLVIVLGLFALLTYSLAPYLMRPTDGLENSVTLQLTDEQRKTILTEATETYQEALELKQTDPAESKERFAKSASQFQMLVDSGIRDANTYFNLANASLQSDAIGQAIANYRRAKKKRPLDFAIARNLGLAEQKVLDSDSPAVSSVTSWVGTARNVLLSFPSALLFWLVVLSWSMIWLIVLVGNWWPGLASRRLLVAATAVLICGAFWLTFQHHAAGGSMSAVVVSRTPSMYSGSSETFDPIPSAGVTIGDSLQVIQQRGQWIQVQTKGGTTGWMRASELEMV